MPTFLLEIGAEEIPDWMIGPALDDLHGKFETAFGEFGGDAPIADATPRRLLLIAKNLAEVAPDVQTLAQGPYLSAGPKAAEGFARKCGVGVAELEKTQDAKGERYVFHQLAKGQALTDALREKLPQIITGLRFPKTMYWTGKGGMRFIRPIRWIVAVLDDRVVPFEIAGVASGNSTRGHRILGSKEQVKVSADTYEEVLRRNFVIVRAQERRERITSGLGEDVQHDDGLLETLVYLTEYPTPIRGSFDVSYLELPREILSTVMRHHQRYFSVLNEDGSLAHKFVAVTNTDGDPDGLIQQGNERVLRARFNDARFFWRVDQQRPLRDRVADLESVTFQAELGTYRDKTDRVVVLATKIAGQLGCDADAPGRAALLCKCDLTSDMVKEFTELQGVVGGLYARAQGESEAVATAIYDHYQPTSMEAAIPRTIQGQIVSLADKLDTLRECFRIGLAPTGSKDPFGLRRAAQGVVKILFEARLSLNLVSFIEDVPQLEGFVRERIDYYLREASRFPYDEVNAVLAMPLRPLNDVADRVDALHHVRPTADFEPLAASFKRIKNILRQANAEKVLLPLNAEKLTSGPERDLYKAFSTIQEEINDAGSYREKLSKIASLRPHVDLFFDKILVNDPDPAIRQNRLALLDALLREFSTIADFSEIVTQGQKA